MRQYQLSEIRQNIEGPQKYEIQPLQ